MRVLFRCLLALALAGFPALTWAQPADPPVSLTAANSDCSTASTCAVLSGPAPGVAIALTPVTGTFQAEFEITYSGGRLWSALSAFPPGSTTGVSSASAAGQWRGAAGGLVRVRLSSCTSCSVLVTLTPLAQAPTSGGGGGGLSTSDLAFNTGNVGATTLRVTVGADDDVSDAATLFKTNMVAHDAVDAGNPLKIGGAASTNAPTAVSVGDRVNSWFNTRGALAVFITQPDGTVPSTLATDVVEDAAHSNGASGPMPLTRRIDTPAASCDTSGDNCTFNSGPEGGLYNSPVATAGVSAGATTYAVITTASTNAANVKASAGNLYGIHAVNTTASLAYLRLYNASGSPTCSSATGFVESIPIPASTSGAGIVIPFPVGKAFTTGIAHCITGGGSSTDNTNAGASIYVGMEYK